MRSRLLVAGVAPLLAVAAGAARTTGAAQQAVRAPSATLVATMARAEVGEGKFKSVEFLSRHVGWAVGEHGKQTFVFRTADGGHTWERLTFDDGDHTDTHRVIRFADARTGWIVGRDHVLRTSDGGTTWERVTPKVSMSLSAHSLLVLGPDEALVGGMHGTVHRTRDGGRQWERAVLVNSSTRDVTGLARSAPDAIWAVTAGDFDAERGIYRSRDDGATWTLVQPTTVSMSDVAFRDERHGVAVGHGTAYYTEDGGATWKATAIQRNRARARWLDDRTIVATGERPIISISRDAGRTWAAFMVNAPQLTSVAQLMDLVIVDAGWWFAAGDYGVQSPARYHDPSADATFARTSITLSRELRAAGRTLPPGRYAVAVAHRDTAHVVTLALQEAATPGTRCASCTVTLPATVEYAEVERGSGGVMQQGTLVRATQATASLDGETLRVEATLRGPTPGARVLLQVTATARIH